MMQVVAIINPQAGRGAGRRLLSVIEEGLTDHCVRVVMPDSREAAAEATRQAVQAGADTVIAVGGDGTAQAVARALIGSNCRLGLVPTGSANDLARACSIPTEPRDALRVALVGRAAAIDVVKVNGWCFLTCGGLGLPSDVIERVERARCETRLANLLFHDGSLRYAAAAAVYLGTKPAPLHSITIRTPTATHSVRAHALIVANQATFGKRFTIAPRASNCDGLLDVCVLTETGSRTALLANVVHTISGRHAGRAGVELFSTPVFTVETEEMLPFFGDGELHPPDRTFRIQVVPHALSLIVPGQTYRPLLSTSASRSTPASG